MRGALRVFVPLAILWTPSALMAADDVHPGEALYHRYCGACHGKDAKGDGVVATVLRPKPSDLTMIAENNGGQFPAEEVAKVIDGRTMPRAHGDPQMPVWGEVFDEEGARSGQPAGEIQKTVRLITDYLKSVQVK